MNSRILFLQPSAFRVSGSRLSRSLLSKNLLAGSLARLPQCELRRTRDAGGGVTLSLHVSGQAEPEMFGSISLEPGSGRFYRTYETGWPGREKRKERHYFVDAHDAARYLQFLVASCRK